MSYVYTYMYVYTYTTAHIAYSCRTQIYHSIAHTIMMSYYGTYNVMLCASRCGCGVWVQFSLSLSSLVYLYHICMIQYHIYLSYIFVIYVSVSCICIMYIYYIDISQIVISPIHRCTYIHTYIRT